MCGGRQGDRRSRLRDRRGEEGTVARRRRFGVLGRRRTGCAGGYHSFLGRRRGREAHRMLDLHTQLNIR